MSNARGLFFASRRPTWWKLVAVAVAVAVAVSRGVSSKITRSQPARSGRMASWTAGLTAASSRDTTQRSWLLTASSRTVLAVRCRRPPPRKRRKSATHLEVRFAGQTDDCSLYQSEPLHLAQVQPGHDRLAGSGFVCQEEAKQRLRQHRAVDGGGLMGVGAQLGGGDCAGLGIGSRGAHPAGPHAGEDSCGVPGSVGLDLRDRVGVVGGQLDFVDATSTRPATTRARPRQWTR